MTSHDYHMTLNNVIKCLLVFASAIQRMGNKNSKLDTMNAHDNHVIAM